MFEKDRMLIIPNMRFFIGEIGDKVGFLKVK